MMHVMKMKEDMAKRICFRWLFPVLVLLLTACSDDDYQYPPVKLEFLTAFSGADGTLQTILTDEGKRFPVAEDASGMKIGANSFVRIVSNYAPMKAVDGADGVKLYGTLSAISPVPLPVNKFENGIKTDPVELQSIWMGLDYLNILLGIKAQEGRHLFHFVEDENSMDTTTGHVTVRLRLFHDQGNDVQAYIKRAYLSVPLAKYVGEGVQKVTIYFSLNTYSGELKTYQFEYIPNLD